MAARQCTSARVCCGRHRNPCRRQGRPHAIHATLDSRCQLILRLSTNDEEAFKLLNVANKSHRTKLTLHAADLVLFGGADSKHASQPCPIRLTVPAGARG